jgi:hypothetical protein
MATWTVGIDIRRATFSAFGTPTASPASVISPKPGPHCMVARSWPTRRTMPTLGAVRSCGECQLPSHVLWAKFMPPSGTPGRPPSARWEVNARSGDDPSVPVEAFSGPHSDARPPMTCVGRAFVRHPRRPVTASSGVRAASLTELLVAPSLGGANDPRRSRHRAMQVCRPIEGRVESSCLGVSE